MAADDVRDQLARSISFADEELSAGIPAEELADWLLPVVDRIAREAAAKALRDAADWYRGSATETTLRARAEAAERGQA